MKILGLALAAAGVAFATALTVHVVREMRGPMVHPQAFTSDDFACFRRTVSAT